MKTEMTGLEDALEKNKKFKDFMNRIEFRLEGSTEDDISNQPFYSSLASFDKVEIWSMMMNLQECYSRTLSPCLGLN
jgi:hypothetical protein